MSKDPIFSAECIHWEQPDHQAQPLVEVCSYSWQDLQKRDRPKNFSSYWHICWNRKEGAKLLWQDQIWNMTSKELFLIPSHITAVVEPTSPILHFSIDFKVGAQYEKVKRKIYTFSPDFLRKALRDFRELENPNTRLMLITSIASYYLSRIPEEDFPEQEKENLDPRIAKVVTLMASDFTTHFSNEELCQKAGMSRNNFYRLFLKETRKTPKYFLMEQRMLRASYLLRNTDKIIEDIALETGYADRYHFSKVFQNFFGLSPVRYRRKNTPPHFICAVNNHQPNEAEK